MKNILITGADSYIGTSFEKWCSKYPGEYNIATLDMKQQEWRDFTFAGYDTIFHVAGIAHVSSNEKLKDTYFNVNCDLAVEAANKAKDSGVGQFIYMSSIKVYNSSEKRIDGTTMPDPDSYYGQSKLAAEQQLKELKSKNFNIVILRPPMVYGKKSKGNYLRLEKLAKKTILFPGFENKRSMIYINNLCELVRLIIDSRETGTFYPQNEQYVTTYKLIQLLSEKNDRKIYFTKIFNPIIKLLIKKVTVLDKVFGNLTYDMELSKYKENYNITEFKQSVTE